MNDDKFELTPDHNVPFFDQNEQKVGSFTYKTLQKPGETHDEGRPFGEIEAFDKDDNSLGKIALYTYKTQIVMANGKEAKLNFGFKNDPQTTFDIASHLAHTWVHNQQLSGQGSLVLALQDSCKSLIRYADRGERTGAHTNIDFGGDPGEQAR